MSLGVFRSNSGTPDYRLPKLRQNAIVSDSQGIYKLRPTRMNVAALVLLLTTVSQAIAEPTPYRAVYKATYNGVPISATGIRELRQDESGRFVLSSVAKAFVATIEESTTFTTGGTANVRPHEYRYDRRGIGRKESDLLRFDWDEMTVARVAEEDAWTRDMPEGVQDRLSYQQEMREELLAAFIAGEPWPEMSYQVAEDDGRIREYRFRVVGEETVHVPAGTFKTIKAERVRNHDRRTTHFWLAPEQEFLLIRFEQTEADGDGFKLFLKEAELAGTEVVAQN